MSNLSDNFLSTNTFGDFESGQHSTARPFTLNEFVAKKKGEERRFIFDSEKARNFDEIGIKKAREGVSEIISNAIIKAKEKSVEIKHLAQKEGYETGYMDGFQKGEQTAREELALTLKMLQEVVQHVSEFRKIMFPKVEREMIEMILGLTKRVIHHELSIREDSVKEMIRIAAESVLGKEKMTIRINPADKIHAESFRPELLQMFEEIKNLTFEAHPSIEKGGCVIESNFGTVDARIEKLDEQISKILNLAPHVPEQI